VIQILSLAMTTLACFSALQGAIITLEYQLATLTASPSRDEKYAAYIAWEDRCRSSTHKRDCSWKGLAQAIGVNPGSPKSVIIEKLDRMGIVFRFC
jgi:hypothetical protein